MESKIFPSLKGEYHIINEIIGMVAPFFLL